MKVQRVYVDTSGLMKKTTIRAVEMVRRIRDAHYEQLRGRSDEERIAFYRAKARLLEAEIAAQRQKQRPADHSAHSGSGSP